MLSIPEKVEIKPWLNFSNLVGQVIISSGNIKLYMAVPFSHSLFTFTITREGIIIQGTSIHIDIGHRTLYP